MQRFYEFIKSPQAPIFALATMILTFFQMYAKLYYHHNPYQLNVVLDIIIALVAAGGLSTITFIIIVHSKKTWMPIFFAGLDFIGGLLFYGKDLINFYEQGAYIDIGSALFIPFFKASAIYFVGEIFLEEVGNSTQEHKELNEKTEALKNLKLERENQSLKIDQLEKQLQISRNEFSELQLDSQEWKKKGLKYEINNLKRSIHNTNNEERKAEKKRELIRLEEMLEEESLLETVHMNGHPIQ